MAELADEIPQGTLIPQSASGIGAGVVSSTLRFQTTDIKGEFLDSGLLKVTGTRIYKVDEWIYIQNFEALKAFFVLTFKDKWKDGFLKLHWSDILALSLLSKTKGTNPYTQRQGYRAGNGWVYMDELKVTMIIQEIADSNTQKDWNLIIKREFPTVPDDTTQVDSPFNPKSENYKPEKPVFTYDPDNGYIIYKSGEIIWTKTNGSYYDPANGGVVSYDKATQTVTFANGQKLNLVTLQLLKTNKQVEIIKNTLPWYQEIFRNLLSDSKTQLYVLTAMGILLFIKKKRNDGKN